MLTSICVLTVLGALPTGATPADGTDGCDRPAIVERAPAESASTATPQQQEKPGRGDDLARIRRWRTFLDRANRAFFAARMSTAQVEEKIEQADARIEELEAAAKDPDDPGGRSDITGDVAFLERAQRAFTAAHMNTADVNRWLEEARERGGG